MKRCVDCSTPIEYRATRCNRCDGKRKRTVPRLNCRGCGKPLGKHAHYEGSRRCRGCAPKTRAGRARRAANMREMQKRPEFRAAMLRAGAANLAKGSAAITAKCRAMPYRAEYTKLRKRLGAPEAKRRLALVLSPGPARFIAALSSEPGRYWRTVELIEFMWPDPDRQPDAAWGVLRTYACSFRRVGIKISGHKRLGYRLEA